ncbi:MAG: porin family protein [Parabacteroides sp.]
MEQMKKIWFVLLCTVSSLTLQAQSKWQITPEAGLSINHENEGNESTYINFKAGASVRYTLKEGMGQKPDFGLQSGLYLRMERGSYHPFAWGNIPTGEGYRLNSSSSDVTRFYLQLPVMAHWSFRVADEVRINLGVGPYVAVGLGGHSNVFMHSTRYADPEVLEEHPERPSCETRFDNVNFNPFKGTQVNPEFSLDAAPRFDWGGIALAGIQVKRVSFNIQYEMAWGKIYKQQNDLRLRDHAVNFLIGYTF